MIILSVFSSVSAQTDLVNEGRKVLFKNGNPFFQGIINANKKFKAAVNENNLDQEAHLFYAVTRLASFFLKTSGGSDFKTFADIVQAMGAPFQLRENPRPVNIYLQ